MYYLTKYYHVATWDYTSILHSMDMDNYLIISIDNTFGFCISEWHYDKSGLIIAIISSLETTKLIPTIKSKYFHFEAFVLSLK